MPRYGEGSVSQRCEARYECPPPEDGKRPAHKCKGRWYGTIEAGWTEQGTRRRITVSATNRTDALRRMQERRRQLDKGGVSINPRKTVKQYAEEWLEAKVRTLRPKAFAAAASPIRKWIIPTIGHRRLSDLSPAHVRELERVQREAGLKGATAAATQRTLINMLKSAEEDGYLIPRAVLVAKKPATAHSDRLPIPPEDLAKVLEQASMHPNGLRWLLALLYGWRQGEVLGLTRDSFDFDRGIVFLDWQLQQVPYVDRSDKRRGFRVPDEYNARRLVDSWHLVAPKSKAGVRTAPIPAELMGPLREAVGAISNPYGLLFPDGDRPRNDKTDRAEWWALQEAAGVAHPNGRPYHVHECRNVAASRLRLSGADDLAVTALMGHTSISTTRLYQRVDDAGQRAAIEASFAGLK